MYQQCVFTRLLFTHALKGLTLNQYVRAGDWDTSPGGNYENQYPDTISINALRPSDAYICVGTLAIIGPDNGLSPSASLVQIMACRLAINLTLSNKIQ